MLFNKIILAFGVKFFTETMSIFCLFDVRQLTENAIYVLS